VDRADGEGDAVQIAALPTALLDRHLHADEPRVVLGEVGVDGAPGERDGSQRNRRGSDE